MRSLIVEAPSPPSVPAYFECVRPVTVYVRPGVNRGVVRAGLRMVEDVAWHRFRVVRSREGSSVRIGVSRLPRGMIGYGESLAMDLGAAGNPRDRGWVYLSPRWRWWSWERRVALVAHEMGHVMGLKHVGGWAVMNPYVRSTEWTDVDRAKWAKRDGLC